MTLNNARNADQDGSQADTPTQIPARGWKEILQRTFEEVGKDRVLLVAAGVTFYLLLAMVPSLTAIVSIYGLVTDPSTVSDQMQVLNQVIPEGARDIIQEQLSRLSRGGSTTLGLTAGLSILIALWSANAGVKAMFEAMNVAYDETENRGFIRLTLVSLAFTLTGIILVIVFLSATVILPTVFEILQLGSLAEIGAQALSVVLLLVLTLAGLAALYRWGPDRSEAEWKWISPGAIAAIVIAAIGSSLFTWYASNFGSYNETYGSLGAIIGMMTWLWIMTIFIVLGAELNAEMEHQTAQDTTIGEDEPMGSRGAVKADNVAPTK